MGRPLLFALNGERVELKEVDPRMTVLQYIRLQTSLQGTKLSCGEGGCGACTVLLSKYDCEAKRVEELTINSCLALLCSIDGSAITTTEGLKTGPKKELHAVHKRIAGFHASQCGFCTPGMSMSMYGSLRKAASKCEAQPGTSPDCNGHAKHSTVPGLTAREAQTCISGNICRCTGYRPLLDACKSFSGDVDVEDLGLNVFWGSKQDADATLLPPYNPEEDPKFPKFLIEALEARKKAEGPLSELDQNTVLSTGTESPEVLSFKHVEGSEVREEYRWIAATSLAEVFTLLQQYTKAKLEVKLVVGNTSAGVYKSGRPQVYIDLSQVPELHQVKIFPKSVELGAAVSLTKLLDLIESEKGSVVFSELAKHVKQIASQQVRNRASLGGNLVLAQKLGFDSDLATILLGAGTEVTLASANGRNTLTLEEFLSQPGLDPETILLSVHIPSWNAKDAGNAGSDVLFKTYRISSRPEGNAVSYINAAFLAITDTADEEKTVVLRDVRLAFGAFGGPHAIRARNTEKLLVGKALSPSILLEAVKELKKEIKPPPSVHKSAFRSSVAVGFFFDFFKAFLSSPSTVPSTVLPLDEETENGHHIPQPLTNGMANGHDTSLSLMNGVWSGHGKVQPLTNGLSNADDKSQPLTNELSNGDDKSERLTNGVSNGDDKSQPLTNGEVQEFEYGTKRSKLVKKLPSVQSSSQKFATSKEFWPVAQPTKKIAVGLQASGEAVYVDDMPLVNGTLYATLVLSDKQPGQLLGIDTSEALKSPGVVDFLTAKDIPGVNQSYFFFFYEDRLFAEDRVECVNDILGLMVADSPEHSKEAAGKVKAQVEEEAGIYTIEEAVAAESYGSLGLFQTAGASSYGEFPSKVDHRIENAEVSSGSQYNFYMEAQVAYAVPDEDGCITVYSSNQSPNSVQKAIATCLGIPMNSVRVIVRRLGGGFGGKMTRASTVAVSCALAAYKLKRPVKMYLDRETDMQICVGRHEVKAIYNVDFNADGKVAGLEAKLYLDSGRARDLSAMVLVGVNSGLRQYDWGALKTEGKLCKTSKVSRGILRGPGEVQGHFIAETVIEHVAAYLGMDAHKVRERNMHTLESMEKFHPLSPCSADDFTIPHIWQKLKNTSHFEKRLLAVEKFNQESKWVKKGIDIVMGAYNTGMMSRQARVSIFDDASIVVEVAGIEMGQGLWTKVRQAVAFGLSKLWGPDAHPLEKVEMSRIRVVQTDSLSMPNAEPTGGSTGSEGSCQAALMACEKLVENVKPFLQQLRANGANPAPWEAIVGTAKFGGAVLSAQGDLMTDLSKGYVNFGACVSEVAIDVLTGSTIILQTDLLYDCGRSLNPAVDIGQVEGAFVMGVGFYLTEEWREEKGKIISNNTWNYKPPTVDNIPKRFHVELSNTKASKERILSSKASGEPPFLLAKSVHSAVRHAIRAARKDLQQLPQIGEEETAKGNAYFRLDTPASVDKVKTLCGLENVERYLTSLQ